MKKATLHLHSQLSVGQVDPRIFGGFLEHLGRAVYEGVYEPASRHANGDGFRKDVMGALSRLAMTTMRYPGGNFASGYHWMDGVGPAASRPKLREMAWQSTESNEFGTDEYIKLCREMDWTPMLTVNLGTGSAEEARNWVEYCNCAAGTRYADMRVSSGKMQPYGVKLWCLGNEMDGPWQLGHVPADQYAIRAQQAAKMMKDTDGSIELIACGSCGISMNTYMEWDKTVLQYMGDAADYISLHRYVGNNDNDTADYLAVTASVDRQIEEMDAACRFVQAQRKSKKRAYLCFDEWNVWYKNHEADGAGKIAPPLLEEIYNLEDALVVAGFLHSFVRHADVLKIANLAQIVNVIAPLLTKGDQMLVQSIFYPFAMFSKRRSGVALRVAVDGTQYESRSYGPVTHADASAILGDGKLHLFVTNRSLDEPMEVCVKPGDFQILSVESAELLTGPGPKAENTFESPNVVLPQDFHGFEINHGSVRFELPPLAFVALTAIVRRDM